MKSTPDSIQARRFGTTDLAIVLALWSAMAVVLGGVLSEVMADNETPMARAQSEAYALQLAQSQNVSEMRGRGPASLGTRGQAQAGELGKDPWGKSYQYRTFSNGVVVWSSGADGSSQSEEPVERLVLGQGIGEFHFRGDDIGFVKMQNKGL